MKIAAIQGSSTIDYPDQISCVLFTQGCPYDCFYCHNRSLISPLGGGDEDLFAFLAKRRGLLDAVVISGGEPTMQSDLVETVKTIKQKGFLVKLDTNGCNPAVVNSLVEMNLLDYLALDVKATVKEYPHVCGPAARWEPVSKTLNLLRQSTIAWEVRTTVYPTLSFSELQEIADTIGSIPLWRLNSYRIPPQYKEEDNERILHPAHSKEALLRWVEKKRKDLPPSNIII